MTVEGSDGCGGCHRIDCFFPWQFSQTVEIEVMVMRDVNVERGTTDFENCCSIDLAWSKILEGSELGQKKRLE